MLSKEVNIEGQEQYKRTIQFIGAFVYMKFFNNIFINEGIEQLPGQIDQNQCKYQSEDPSPCLFIRSKVDRKALHWTILRQILCLGTFFLRIAVLTEQKGWFNGPRTRGSHFRWS